MSGGSGLKFNKNFASESMKSKVEEKEEDSSEEGSVSSKDSTSILASSTLSVKKS